MHIQVRAQTWPWVAWSNCLGKVMCQKSQPHLIFCPKEIDGILVTHGLYMFSPWTSRGVLQFLKQFKDRCLREQQHPKTKLFSTEGLPPGRETLGPKTSKKQQLGWALGAEALVALHDLGPPGALLLASRGFPPVAIRGSESWEHQLWRFSSVGWRRIYGNGPMINLSRVCGKSEVDQKNNSYIYILNPWDWVDVSWVDFFCMYWALGRLFFRWSIVG